MIFGINKNIWLLAFAQALFLAGNLTSVSVVGLAGAMLAPDPMLSTLPFALVIVGSALATIPASFFMKKTSRRTGFFLGASLGTIAFALAITALFFKSFWGLALATFIQGFYTAFTAYYRFAAVEAVKPALAGKAISMVLAGGVFAALLGPTFGREFTAFFEPEMYVGAYVFMMVLSLIAVIPIYFLSLPKVVEEKSSLVQRPLLQIFKQPVAALSVLNSAVGWALMVLVMAAAPLKMHGMGFTFMDTSLVIQFHVLAMYAPGFITGGLITRFGVGKVLLLGYLAFIFSIFSGFMGMKFGNFAFTLAALGVGWNFLFVGGTTLLTRAYNSDEKAKVQGANEFIVFGIAASSGLLSGPLLDLLGWEGILQGAAIALSFVMIITIGYGTNVWRKNKLDLK